MRITLEFDSAAEFSLLLPSLISLQERQETGLEKVADRFAKAAEEKKASEESTAPTEKAPAQPKTEVPKESISLADVKKALKGIPGAREKAKAALAKLEVESISDLDEKGLAAFMIEIGSQG